MGGLQGPAMIGRGNPYLGHHDASHFGTFGSQGVGSFGFAPNYEYRTGQGFGGFGGYGPHGNYAQGAAAWGNPSPPFYTQFNPAMGYGYYQPTFPSPTATPESNSQAADEGQEEERDGRDGHQPQGTQPLCSPATYVWLPNTATWWHVPTTPTLPTAISHIWPVLRHASSHDVSWPLPPSSSSTSTCGHTCYGG